jgi:hypothetical protein
MRNLTLMLAAALILAACQDKPIEPMKPKVASISLISPAT